ncbi:MAG TPA: hypothetical protein VK934_10390 [Fimbriimonas sp.]|nr:hypothetical protein [Fimbriimonas sp.]
MPELHEYLSEVRHRLLPEMPPEQADAVLLETEQHLQERILALEELGFPYEAATEEALSVFGPADRFAIQMLDSHQPSAKIRDAKIVKFAIGASAAAVVIMQAAILLNWFNGLFLATMPLLAIAAVSFRARRIIPHKQLPVAFGFLLAFTAICGATQLGLASFGGTGVLPPWQVESFTDFYRNQLSAGASAADLEYARTQLRAVEQCRQADFWTNAVGSFPQCWPFGLIWFILLAWAQFVGAGLGISVRMRRMRIAKAR